MDLSVIIVNYKSREKVLKCLEALKRADWGDLVHEIIVVDNASGDDFSALPEIHPEVKIIKSEKNLGMGGGNNFGARESTGEYILVLNPDTAVERDAIRHLFEYLDKNPEAGIVGPKLLYPDGSLQYSCLRFPKIHTPLLRRTPLGKLFSRHLDEFVMKHCNHNETCEVDWLMGSCLLIRRDIFDRDGFLFDEKYFMYFEDTDLCRRAQDKHCYRVVYHPRAVVVHDHMRESAEKPWFIAPFTDKLAREHIRSWMKYFIG